MDINRTASRKVWESSDHALLFARWSFEPADRALIFVHGLASSWDVWHPFCRLIESADLKRTDVFFYDYKSLGTTISDASKNLRDVMKGLTDGTSSVFVSEWFPSSRSKPKYSRFDMVAHSLGGVVLRQALTELANECRDRKDPKRAPEWKVDQLLLAPALHGSKLPWLIKYLGTEALFSAIQFVRNGGVSAVMDLKEGSTHLNALECLVKDQLKELPGSATACGLQVMRTFHGTRDHVVIKRLYARDENYETREANHFTIVPQSANVDSDFILGNAK